MNGVFFIGCAVSAWGIFGLLSQFYSLLFGVVVPGTVVSQWKQRVTMYGHSAGEGHQFKPYSRIDVNDVVSFQPLGSVQPVTLNINTESSSHPVGSRVQVMYLPGKLRRARLKGSALSEAGRWITPCLRIVVGLGIASFGLLFSLTTHS